MESTVLAFENVQDEPLPPEFDGQDIRLAKGFIRYVLEKYTQVGDVILDPFAGYATTLIVAEQLDRVCFGIEADRRRYEYGVSKLRRPDLLLHGDALALAGYNFPPLDLVLFSPPYLHRSYGCNPLRGELPQENCYDRYLEDLGTIASSAAKKLKAGGHLIAEASNLSNETGVTTLAWDLAALLSREFNFKGEQVINWAGGYGYGYSHSYCLVFSQRA